MAKTFDDCPSARLAKLLSRKTGGIVFNEPTDEAAPPQTMTCQRRNPSLRCRGC
jgi:hypothetical protein